MAQEVKEFTALPELITKKVNDEIDKQKLLGLEPKPIWWCVEPDFRITVRINFRKPNKGAPNIKHISVSNEMDAPFTMASPSELINVNGVRYLIAIVK